MAAPLRTYKDLDLSFTTHPITNDLVYLYDDDAIKRAVKNIILTNFNERHFDEYFGSGVRRLLFEPLSYFTSISLHSYIERALKMFEPRVTVSDISVKPNIDENGYEVNLTFTIKSSLLPVTVTVFLERLR